MKKKIMFCAGWIILLCLLFVTAVYTTPSFAQKDQPEFVQTSLEQYRKINLNTATDTQLCLLPGVGIKKADLIIEYRLLIGEFQSVEDVVNVSGITDKMLEEWGEQAYVSPLRN